MIIDHGVNVVDKRPPYIPPPDEFGEADVEAIKRDGFTSVRLGMIWKGIEPRRGQFDETYLNRVQAIVSMLTAAGIDVLLDMHQDVWNERYGGEGAPNWAVLDDGVLFDPQSPWSLGYLQPATGNAFSSFLLDRDGIRTEYAAMWRHVAARFVGQPGILGYEVMNEPFLGSLWPLFFLNDGVLLDPFYRQVLAAIRSVDSGHIVFWEPNVMAFAPFPSTVSGLGDPNTAISHHVYCLPYQAGLGDSDALCQPLERDAFDLRRNERDANAAGWMVTEFGGTDDPIEIARVAKLADENLSGWDYWSWKYFDDPTGDPDEALVADDRTPKAKLAILARTNATAIAGIPLQQSFDPM